LTTGLQKRYWPKIKRDTHWKGVKACTGGSEKETVWEKEKFAGRRAANFEWGGGFCDRRDD